MRGEAGRNAWWPAVRAFAVPAMVWVVAFCVVCLLNVVGIYADLWANARASGATILKLLVFNMPPILAVALPGGFLFAGMQGLPRLVELRGDGAQAYRAATGFLVVALVASAAAFAFHEHVVTWANRKVVEVVRVALIKDRAPSYRQRSPQEMDREYLGALILQRREEIRREVAVAAIASPDVEEVPQVRDMRENLAELEAAWHMRVAIPASNAALAALGLAIGLVTARRRRRPLPLPIAAGLGFGISALAYLLVTLGARAPELIGGPALGAWLVPVAALAAASLILGVDRLARRHRP